MEEVGTAPMLMRTGQEGGDSVGVAGAYGKIPTRTWNNGEMCCDAGVAEAAAGFPRVLGVRRESVSADVLGAECELHRVAFHSLTAREMWQE